jgi:diguanylate cyclase (GGDEF)-like protein/PAS domain S-box-containing protein
MSPAGTRRKSVIRTHASAAPEGTTELSALLAAALTQLALRGSDLIALIDPAGRIRDASPSFALCLGRDAGTLPGLQLPELLHPADRPALEYLITGAAPPQHTSPPIRVRAAQGRWRYLQFAVVDCRHLPELRGYALSGRDVTDTALATAISRTIRHADGFASAFDVLGRLLSEVVAVNRVSLGVLDDARLRFVAAYGERAAEYRGVTRPLDANQHHALREIRGSLLVKDTLADGGRGDPVAFTQGGTRSYVSSPVFVADQVIGTLTCASTTPNALDKSDARLLHRVVASIGASLFLLHQVDDQRHRVDSLQAQSDQFSAEARTDALTGLPNRRAWDESVAVLTDAASASGPLCVAMLDLDNFKLYNDTHGHLAGDEFLRLAADAWHSALRRGDVLARYGGEEFGLLLPGCTADSALRIVGTLAANTPFEQTVSGGIAQWQPGWGPDELVRAADAALYRAKQSGRDQIIAA